MPAAQSVLQTAVGDVVGGAPADGRPNPDETRRSLEGGFNSPWLDGLAAPSVFYWFLLRRKIERRSRALWKFSCRESKRHAEIGQDGLVEARNIYAQ